MINVQVICNINICSSNLIIVRNYIEISKSEEEFDVRYEDLSFDINFFGRANFSEFFF